MQRRNLIQQLVWVCRAVVEYRNPWWYLRLRRGPQRVLFRKGGTLLVRDYQDAVVVNEIFLGRIYDQTFRGARSVIDIGGNIGAATLRAKQLGAKRITTYEPASDNYQTLVANAGTYATCIHAAVGDKNGTTKLYLGQAHGLHSMVHHTKHYETVRLVKLDHPKADAMKIDAEDMEPTIIKATNLNDIQRLATEATPNTKIDEYLHAIGYRVTRTYNLVYARREHDPIRHPYVRGTNARGPSSCGR